MKKVIFLLVMFLLLGAAASYAVVVHYDDYEDRTVGSSTEGWHWGGGVCTHSGHTYEIYDGSIVRKHTGTIDNTTGTAAQDGRYGFKMDIPVTGNTSADPADYTIELDLRNLSGNWDPLGLEVWVLTYNPAVGTSTYGHGFPTVELSQSDGWVHVKFNLAEYTKDWWEGTEWDLTNSTWSIEIGMPWPGVSVPVGAAWTQIFLVDNLKIMMGSDTEAHDPVVLPMNPDGSVGTLISQMEAQVTLGWMAGGDPNIVRDYPVNPAIVGHYIYLSRGSNDPNLHLLDYVEQVHNEDPYQTDPYNEYGPITLAQGTTYYWQVEEVLSDPNGTPYGPGDPGNIMGVIWTFTTIAATPKILAGPEHALADFNGNASFTITPGPAATHCRWFKVGSPDIQLTDGGIYSGTQTPTLTITGATVADEGEYYCIVYNGDPEEGGIPSEPSPRAKLWYPRLVSHYPFETIADGVSPDIISGFDAVMMQAGSAPLPGLNSTEARVGNSCLQLDNPDSASADGQYAQIPAGVADYKDITISVWVHPKSIIGWTRLFDFGNGTDDYLFVTPDAGWGVLRFAIKVGGAAEQLLEGTSLPAGQWSHVAVTITGDTGRLYRNGELIAVNTAMTFNPIEVGAVLNYLGKSQYTADPEFNGLIDDLKIWNYALTTYDIAQEYLAVAGGSVCNREELDLGEYDADGDCRITLADFASFAARWLEDDRIYPVQ
jgi:hypothetical protein